MSPLKIIFYSFVFLVLLGSVLLCLPVSSRSGNSTPFLTSYFTATSAVCVTGLIKVDTYTYWSPFGQAVILGLIQIGGMGFMTICITALSITKKKIGFASRTVLQNSISAPNVGGIVRMTRFMILGTITVELIGALLLSFVMCPKYGIFKGIWFSLFHSISAFCNAGFDLLGGTFGKFSSLTGFQSNWYVLAIISFLIVVGGLGFFVWRDIIDNKFKFSKFRLQTKVVLTVTALLIVGGALILFIFETVNPAFVNKDILQKVSDSLFQSITTRTAGFNSIDIPLLSQSSLFLMIMLMLIGGSPGSTAGGMKTTTLAVLGVSVFNTFKRKKTAEIFGRRLQDSVTRIAVCICMLYLFFSISFAMIISTVEGIPFINCLFETASAIATVGLTTGITSSLGTFSSILLTILMLFGRVGSMTMLLAFSTYNTRAQALKPLEKIQLG